MRKPRPIIAAILALVLTVSMLPVQILAEDESPVSSSPVSSSQSQGEQEASSSTASQSEGSEVQSSSSAPASSASSTQQESSQPSSASSSSSSAPSSLAPSSLAPSSLAPSSSVSSSPEETGENGESLPLMGFEALMDVPVLTLPAGNIVKMGDNQTLIIKDNNEYEIVGGTSGLFNNNTAIESADLSNESRQSYNIVLENTQQVTLARMIAKGNLTITGAGPLLVQNPGYPALRAQFGTLTLGEGTQIVANTNSSLSTINGAYLELNGSLQVQGAATNGIQAINLIKIGASGHVTTTGKDNGIYVYTGTNLPVSPEIVMGRVLVEGYLEASGGKNGVYAYSGVTATGGTVIGTGTNEYGIVSRSYDSPVEALAGANITGTGSLAGISTDNVWANASTVTGNGGQYGIKNTHRHGTRSAIEAVNGATIKGMGTDIGVAYIDQDQNYTTDKATFIAGGSKLIAIGGLVGYSSTFCGLWVEGAGSQITAEGANFGVHMVNGKINAVNGALLVGTSTAGGSSAITTDASITANAATIRGKAPAFGAGFAAVYRKPIAGNWRVIQALNQGSIEEYYTAPETAGVTFQKPFMNFANMLDFSTYQSWATPTEAEDVLEVDFTGKQGIRGLDLLPDAVPLTVTRTGAATGEPVVLADQSTHVIYLPLLVKGKLRQYTLTVEYQDRAGNQIATAETLVRDKNTNLVTADLPVKAVTDYVLVNWKNSQGVLQGNVLPNIPALLANQTIVLVYGQDKGGTGTDKTTPQNPGDEQDKGRPGTPDNSDGLEDITLTLFWVDENGNQLIRLGGMVFYQDVNTTFTRPGAQQLIVGNETYKYIGHKVGTGMNQGALQQGVPAYGPLTLAENGNVVTYAYEKQAKPEVLSGKDMILYTDEVAGMTAALYTEKGLTKAEEINPDGSVTPLTNVGVDYSKIKGEVGLYPLTFTTAKGTTITVTVRVIEREYTITYVYNNQAPDTYGKSLAGRLIGEPAIPTNAGFTFQGWYTNDEKWNFTQNTMPAAPLTLEARWEKAADFTTPDSTPPVPNSTPAAPTTPTAPPTPATGGADEVLRVIADPTVSNVVAQTTQNNQAAQGGANENQGPQVANVDGTNVPLGGLAGNNAWSLANLLVSIFSLLMLAYTAARRRGKQPKYRAWMPLVQLALLVGTLLLLLLTTPIPSPMVFMNLYTVWFVLLTLLQTGIAYFAIKKRQQEEENL